MHNNLFLVQLLKSFVSLDAMMELNTEKVTISQIVDYIERKQPSYSSGEITKASGTFAENYRKALSNKNFSYSTEFLDMLSQCTKIFGSYTSWKEFVNVFGEHYYTEIASPYISNSLNILPAFVLLEINYSVNRLITILLRTSKQNHFGQGLKKTYKNMYLFTFLDQLEDKEYYKKVIKELNLIYNSST